MNTKIVFTVLAICVVLVMGKLRECKVSEECRGDECCVPHFAGLGSVCRENGDEIGDVCGGAYFCSSCSLGLECVPAVSETEEDSFFGLFDSCPLPANGTCQVTNTANEQSVNDTLDMASVEL